MQLAIASEALPAVPLLASAKGGKASSEVHALQIRALISAAARAAGADELFWAQCTTSAATTAANNACLLGSKKYIEHGANLPGSRPFQVLPL